MIYSSDGIIEDVVARVRAEEREGDPWLMLNMVTSIDGAISVDGGSTALSDDEDRKVFHALRSVADMILVGAGTVRAENYRPVDKLVIVSGSLDLDPEARVFSDPARRPTVLTLEETDASHLEGVADIVRCADLDGATIVSHLSGVVLCEGGPTLNGVLFSAGLVDEINWTIAPLVVGGDSPRMMVGDEVRPSEEFRLVRTWTGERCLFLRYVRNP